MGDVGLPRQLFAVSSSTQIAELHTQRAFRETPFLLFWLGKYFFNNFFMAITTTIGEVITTILAAYAFAKMKFFGKNVLLGVL